MTTNSTPRPRSTGNATGLPPDLRSRPFTLAEARAAGVDRGRLRVAGVRHVFRDVYLADDRPLDPVTRSACAMTIHPSGARISHHTAAILHGVPVPPHPDVHVSVPQARDRRPRPGITSHVCRGSATTIRGLPVSTAVQLFCEMSNQCVLIDLVVLGDALVKRHRIDAATFRSQVSTHRAAAPARAARAVGLVRGGVDSPMETRLRLLMLLAGLPEPVVRHALRDGDGEVIVRFDLAYPDVRLAVEYDGRQHAETSAQWLRDLSRREWLDGQKWRLIVITAEGIFREPTKTLTRIRDALVDLGLDCRPLAPEYLRHFVVGDRLE